MPCAILERTSGFKLLSETTEGTIIKMIHICFSFFLLLIYLVIYLLNVNHLRWPLAANITENSKS